MYLSADSWPDFSTWMSLPVNTVKSIASVSGWSTPSVLPVSSTDPGTLPELTSAKRSTRTGSLAAASVSVRLKESWLFPCFSGNSAVLIWAFAASRNTQ